MTNPFGISRFFLWQSWVGITRGSCHTISVFWLSDSNVILFGTKRFKWIARPEREVLKEKFQEVPRNYYFCILLNLRSCTALAGSDQILGFEPRFFYVLITPSASVILDSKQIFLSLLLKILCA